MTLLVSVGKGVGVIALVAVLVGVGPLRCVRAALNT
jgi:hypothetical protein